MIELNEKYTPLFTDNSRYFVLQGGRASGKSFAVSSWAALLLLFESGHTILYTRYTMKSAHISVIPEFTSKLEKMNVLNQFTITKDEIICNTTGSKIIFRGIKASSGMQTANLKSLEGVTTWILDEAEELYDEEVFDKIDRSIRLKGKQNRVVLILNPATKEHWIYKEFFESKGVQPSINITQGDTTYIHTTYLDNIEELDESFIKKAESDRVRNPKKWEHVMMGGWLDKVEGVCYNNWEIGTFDPYIDYGFGMDYGFSLDPSTCIKVAVDNKKRIIYLHEILYKPYLTTSEIYHELRLEVGKKEIIADSAEPRLIEELKRAGLNIKPCVKGAGSIREGIALINDYKLIVTPESTNIIKELNNYKWSDTKKETPVDMYNHACDAFRYYCQHRIKKPTALRLR